VLVAVDGLADLAPPRRDAENLAGNHVVLDCLGAKVVLAHLGEGSVSVSPGQLVSTQTRLGQVGNSGNTSEPHLHLHVERGGAPNAILDGKGVPFTLDGRYLVRGSVFGSQL
jgi:murein DD-endopeptidase MepM/ murein hydrolase activator NlpD